MTRQGDPFLVFRDPQSQQVLVPIAGRSSVTIGRRAECDISLPWDDRVSRLHAELSLVGGDWVVTDDGLSTNGTWINETRLVGRQRLRDQDVVRVGDTLLGYCAPQSSLGATRFSTEGGAATRITAAQRRVLVVLCTSFLREESLIAPSNAEIAAELFLSVDAIKTHLKALFEAFDLDDVPPRQKRAALIDRAVREGIVTRRDVPP
jgi:FHA domain